MSALQYPPEFEKYEKWNEEQSQWYAVPGDEDVGMAMAVY